MSNDKTLADVQPGGRVRLGDQRSDLVPGIVRCAKCQFQLARSNLNMHSGTVTAGDSKTEPCPNGCGPLWPVTWETWAREGWAEAERLHLENAALSAQPSPGGQGDAPRCFVSLDMLAGSRHKFGEVFDHPQGSFVRYEDHVRALAARQPVGQNWQHIANEWADAATNGVQWLRNIRDGASTVADALACMESNVERIRQLKPQPVGEPVEATDAMVEAALQSTVAHNAAPWRQVVASEDHADFISDMRAAINAALAARPSPLTVETTTTSTQTVPDHCDRIFWQHNYYQLPVGPTDQKKPTKRRQTAVETLQGLGYLWRNDAWIAPPEQAVDLGQLRVLADHATGRINHANNGLCPDQIEGHDARDPDCTVCRALTDSHGDGHAHNFQAVKVVATRNLQCERGCGRKTTRQRIFECTINPFNTNADGSVKSECEVRAQAQAKADAWRPDPYTCKACQAKIDSQAMGK